MESIANMNEIGISKLQIYIMAYILNTRNL